MIACDICDLFKSENPKYLENPMRSEEMIHQKLMDFI